MNNEPKSSWDFYNIKRFIGLMEKWRIFCEGCSWEVPIHVMCLFFQTQNCAKLFLLFLKRFEHLHEDVAYFRLQLHLVVLHPVTVFQKTVLSVYNALEFAVDFRDEVRVVAGWNGSCEIFGNGRDGLVFIPSLIMFWLNLRPTRTVMVLRPFCRSLFVSFTTEDIDPILFIRCL